MAWIESHQELARSYKTARLARRLGVSKVTAIGHLHLLWWWALDFAADGWLGEYTAQDVADAAVWDGDPHVLWDALVYAGFFDCGAEGAELHDWYGGHPSRKERGEVRRAWEAMAARVRPIVLARDSWQCCTCGVDRRHERLEVDHIIAIAWGGTNDLENLQTLCRPCNRRKGAS